VPRVSIVFGLLLIALGLGGYFGTGTSSPTPFIPAGFGLVLLVLGALALKERLRKHAMHAAAGVGLLGAVGAVVRLLQPLYGDKGIEHPVAYGCTAAMAALCLAFVALCVNSFVQARRRRAAPESGPPA
jgi:hypothetical protein